MARVNRTELEGEVRRLSPWYYRFDLDGVRTDITAPCDHHGHREVALPPAASLYLQGKTVLDVGCNEGGYSLAALQAGARRLDGVDCRSINVEKARLVARIRGYGNADFHVSDADAWVRENPNASYDYVFLCGLLYHLPRPWETIRQFTHVAREGIFLTCVLAGGADGYSAFPEAEGIAASHDPSELSMMPNTTRTLAREFEKHSYYPAFVGENKAGAFSGGCSLFVKNCKAVGPDRRPLLRRSTTEDVSVYVLPGLGRDWDVVVYNWLERPLEVEGVLSLLDSSGSLLARIGPVPLRLPARVDRPQAPPSLSSSLAFPVPTGPVARIEAEVRERSTGRCLGDAQVSWADD
jgi:SAM-dependent methyltransferase